MLNIHHFEKKKDTNSYEVNFKFSYFLPFTIFKFCYIISIIFQTILVHANHHKGDTKTKLWEGKYVLGIKTVFYVNNLKWRIQISVPRVLKFLFTFHTWIKQSLTETIMWKESKRHYLPGSSRVCNCLYILSNINSRLLRGNVLISGKHNYSFIESLSSLYYTALNHI